MKVKVQPGTKILNHKVLMYVVPQVLDPSALVLWSGSNFDIDQGSGSTSVGNNKEKKSLFPQFTFLTGMKILFFRTWNEYLDPAIFFVCAPIIREWIRTGKNRSASATRIHHAPVICKNYIHWRSEHSTTSRQML